MGRPGISRFGKVWPFGRVEVTGSSMAPALLPGDRLLIVRSRRARVGDVVVVSDPRAGHRELVKRIVAADGDGVALGGDNEEASTDSRSFGEVPRDTLRGRVLYRYAPRDRAGWLRR